MTVYKFKHPDPEKNIVYQWDSKEEMLYVADQPPIPLSRDIQVGELLYRFLEYRYVKSFGLPAIDKELKKWDGFEVKVIYRRLLEQELGLPTKEFKLFVENLRGRKVYHWKPDVSRADTVEQVQPAARPTEDESIEEHKDREETDLEAFPQVFPKNDLESRPVRETRRRFHAVDNKDEDYAEAIINGRRADWQEMFDLAYRLKNQKKFGYARKLCRRLRKNTEIEPDTRKKIGQLQALCTYKDHGLATSDAYVSALKVLEDTDPLEKTDDPETLGLAGAIYKRMWEKNGQKANLRFALDYYLRGYDRSPEKDNGYTGINAAFICDLLADISERENKAQTFITEAFSEYRNISEKENKDRTFTTKEFSEYRKKAEEIRNDLVEKLPPMLNQPEGEELAKNWWFFVTIAEAYFGLKQYKKADKWLEKAESLDSVPEWEFESTARQLVMLARLHTRDVEAPAFYEEHPAWMVIQRFLGKQIAGGMKSTYFGRLGIALSGGGFRASLFHIGILARLAERDLLRHVEVISCVSGGSIIGVYYCLMLKKLLEENAEEDITREDYIKLVMDLQEGFLEGVQRNIRLRVYSPGSLFAMLRSHHSRTLSLGDLLEKELFAKVGVKKKGKHWQMEDLIIKPKDEGRYFNPKTDNWRRRVKVPILILNAVTLNTGHTWQFTATYMGEPPGSINTEIEKNRRLSRIYYKDAPPKHREFRLGHAVAASACVPIFFKPVTIKGLYANTKVRLVDGGVYDNQGITGLLEHDCQRLIISDASGQMDDESHPKHRPLGVAMRTNDVMMARIRGLQYQYLKDHQNLSFFHNLVYVHLKKGLDVSGFDKHGEESEKLTSYGIQKSIQQKLAGIRTDLDSFSRSEAYSLMYSGYEMIRNEMAQREAFLGDQTEAEVPWPFLELKKVMGIDSTCQEERDELLLSLHVARHRFFKTLRKIMGRW